MNDTQPWERQPWDTDASYACFHAHYLSQSPQTRSLAEAYRRYRRAQGYAKIDVPPTGGWHKWFYGQGSDGPHAGWQTRARAYDDFICQQELARWAARRLAIREEEWGIGADLVARARRMLAAGLFERRVDSANGPVILKPTDWGESDIGKTFDLALKMQRRAAGMEQGTIGVAVDWKRQLAEAGIDAGELFERMVNALANGATPTDCTN